MNRLNAAYRRVGEPLEDLKIDKPGSENQNGKNITFVERPVEGSTKIDFSSDGYRTGDENVQWDTRSKCIAR